MAGSVRPNGNYTNRNVEELYRLNSKDIEHKTQMMVRNQRELVRNLLISFRKYDTLVNRALVIKSPYKKQELANLKLKIDSLRTSIQFQIVGIRNLSADILAFSKTNIDRNSPLPGETQTSDQKSFVNTAYHYKDSAVNGYYLTKKIAGLTSDPRAGIPEPPKTLEQFIVLMKKSLVYDNLRPSFAEIVDEKDRAIAQDLFYHPEEAKNAGKYLHNPSRMIKKGISKVGESLYHISYVGKHTKLNKRTRKAIEKTKHLIDEGKDAVKNGKISLDSLRKFVKDYAHGFGKNNNDK